MTIQDMLSPSDEEVRQSPQTSNEDIRPPVNLSRAPVSRQSKKSPRSGNHAHRTQEYSTEEQHFIWYLRIDRGYLWPELLDRFNSRFSRNKGRRELSGLQCRYYRLLGQYGIPQVRMLRTADVVQTYGMKASLARAGCCVSYPWLNQYPNNAFGQVLDRETTEQNPNLHPAAAASNKRPRPTEGPIDPPAKRSRSSSAKDAKFIRPRESGEEWEDICKNLNTKPDEDKQTRLETLYARLKPDLWEPIAAVLGLPWHVCEAIHWAMGENEIPFAYEIARVYERLKSDLWNPIANELGIPWHVCEAMHRAMGENSQRHLFPEASHYPYGCFRCETPRAFGTCDGWKRHMKEHETVFPCRQCKDSNTVGYLRSYTRKASLVKHLLDTHNISKSDASAQVEKDETVFPCRLCEDSDIAGYPWSYTRKANLAKHLLDTHDMSGSDASARADTWRKTVGKKYFSCGFCVSLFFNIADQLSHIDTEHFQRHQDISGWNISKVIEGLIQQPGVSLFWQKAFGAGYPRSQDFTWNDSVARNLQLRLELSEESAEVLAAAAISQVTWTEIPQDSDDASVTGGFTNPHMEMDQNMLSVQDRATVAPIRSPSGYGCPYGHGHGAPGNLAFTPVNIPPINSPLHTQKNFARDDKILPGFTEFIMGVIDLARRGK